MLAPGAGQQTFTPGDPNSYAQASVSPTGWVAVLWPYANITKETSNSIVQQWQFRMSWVSPSGSVGPVIPLGPMQGGALCGDQSPSCGLVPPVPAITTVGRERALVVFGWPHLSSEEVDGAGQISQITTASRQPAFSDPEYNAVASGGQTVLVTWGGGYVTRSLCRPIVAARWRRGHWEKPMIVAAPSGRACGDASPMAYVNDHGQAALVWWHGTSPTSPTGYAEAAFDF